MFSLLKSWVTFPINKLRLLPQRIFWESWKSFVLFTVILTLFLLFQKLHWLLEWIVSHRVDFNLLGWMLLFSLPSIMLPVMIFAIVGAVFTVVIRYSYNFELVALMASGVSLRSYAQGFLVFGFSVALLVATFSLWLSPLSLRYLNQLQFQAIKTRTFQRIKPGNLNFSLPSIVILSRQVEEGNHLYDVHFMPRYPKDDFSIISALHGFLLNTEKQRQLLLVIENGESLELSEKESSITNIQFERSENLLGGLVSGRHFKNISRIELESTLNLQQRLASDNLGNYARHNIELQIYNRWLTPLACIALVLASVPMAMLDPRSGRYSSYLRAVMLVAVYYLAWLAITNLVKGRGLPSEFMLGPLSLVGCYGLMRLRQLNIRPWF